jgi:hypothetical protein
MPGFTVLEMRPSAAAGVIGSIALASAASPLFAGAR